MSRPFSALHEDPAPGLYRVLVRVKGRRHWKKLGRARVREGGRVDYGPALSNCRCPKEGVLEFALGPIETKRAKLRYSRNDRRLRRINARIKEAQERTAAAARRRRWMAGLGLREKIKRAVGR